MKKTFRLVKLLLVLAFLVLAPTACDSTGYTTYYGYGYGVGTPVGYPSPYGYGSGYGPGWYGPGYVGGVVVVTGPPMPY